MYPNLADAIGRQPNEQLIMTRTTLPPHDEIKPDTPLPLGMAAALVFPDGSMTAFGLRREGARGRLLSSAASASAFALLRQHLERLEREGFHRDPPQVESSLTTANTSFRFA